MTRHHTDMVALLFGLAFAAVGATFLVHELTVLEVDAAWVSAIAFVMLGVVALTATVLRHRRDHLDDIHMRRPSPTETEVAPAPAPEPEPGVDVS